MGKGTGLGLATVYGAVKQNKGFINFVSELSTGTTIKVYFPRYINNTVLTGSEPISEQIKQGKETILLVEDEPAIIRLAAAMLAKNGYTVLTADNPIEALKIAKDCGREIHLLVTDVVMPEMNGLDLANSLLLNHPNLKLLYMSGYTADVIANHGILDSGIDLIQKPFSMKELTSKVREILDRQESI